MSFFLQNFLQPALLLGLPLIGLPILIHLINRQRHRTIPWAAMMFLLDAKRMTRGMARLRYYLIMAMRMLAIFGLVFAVSRPLGCGRFGRAIGGQADTTIIVLDRSASMEQQDLRTGESKRSTALTKLAELARTVGSSGRMVLIDSAENRAQEIESPEILLELTNTSATATSADIPALLQTAQDYVVANQTGRTDIWICSDLRETDWNADDGRWAAFREGFERFQGVRFYLLSYPEVASDNVAVSVTSVRRRSGAGLSGTGTQLVLDVLVRRQSESTDPLSIPIQFVINGARSVLNVEMTETEYHLQGHTIELDAAATTGWGRVELPGDANPQDNIAYFTFAESPEHRTVIVTDDPAVAEPLRIAASAPSDPAVSFAATILSPTRVGEIDWNATSCLVWHAPLPGEPLAQQLTSFIQRGRPVIFLPPATPDSQEIFGARWGSWQQAPADKPLPVAFWNGDGDLLAKTQNGNSLPIARLRIFRYCELEGGGSPLARLDGGAPLLTRVSADGAAAYFLTTLPHSTCSTLAQDGVAFYVMLHRALSLGAATQGNAKLLVAGSPAARAADGWKPLSETGEIPSFARGFHAGAFATGDVLIALNRPEAEDRTAVLGADGVDRLFTGLDYRRVEDQVGNMSALTSEIWRAFLIAMAIALVAEALLCLPERRQPAAEAAIA